MTLIKKIVFTASGRSQFYAVNHRGMALEITPHEATRLVESGVRLEMR